MTLLKQFIKLQWTCKGIISISLFHKGLSPAIDLIPRPTLLLSDMQHSTITSDWMEVLVLFTSLQNIVIL